MDFRDLIHARPAIARHLKSDFAGFCRAAWPHLHRGSKLSWTPAHDLICEYLVAVHEKKLSRLVINCPPRFAKSSIVTIFFPVWSWLQDPTLAFLCCSYEIDLATNHNLDRRRLMDSAWFKSLFGESFQLATDRSQAGEFGNVQGGLMQAASTNSRAQGRGGDVVIVDDPLSADAANSEILRNETNSWFEHQLPQRLNDPAHSTIIVVAQRLHQNDPCGFLLAQENSEWFLLKLPLIAEEDETWTFPISGRVWKRKKGECLDAKRWSPRVVRERQRNRLVWAGQFQQEPMSVEGNLIRTDDIMFFGGRDPRTGVPDAALPERFDRTIVSVDCSFKNKPSSDFVAIVVIGVVGARRYLRHVVNSHLDLTGCENEIRNARAQYRPISATLIEDAANGSAVIAHLSEQIPGVIAVNPEGGKLARVVAASPEFQAHNWYIERGGPWAAKVVEQLTMFPNARNDDITDAVTQASIWLQANSEEHGLISYFKDIFAGKRKMPDAPEAMAKPGTPVETRVDGFKLWQETHKAPPCPNCSSSCTTYMSNGRGGVQLFCKQCRAVNGALPPEAITVGVDCCGDPLAQVIPNGTRCANCGAQSNANVPRGLSRKEYEQGVDWRRRFLN